MNKKFDLLVFVGRMSPFHLGHKAVIDAALDQSENVLVLLGSAGKARTVRNPFTFEERMAMIVGTYEDRSANERLAGEVPTLERLFIEPLFDKTYNDTAWIKQVQDTVNETALNIINDGGFRNHGTADLKIGLIGAAKDHTSYYLKLFPQWESVNVPVEGAIHATNIREGYLRGTFERYQLESTLLPKAVSHFLFDEGSFKDSEHYRRLQKEINHVDKYKKSWSAAPYPVKHFTADAVVEQSGHILLVKRKAVPGKGLWALPGGHVDEYEPVENAVFRELDEETKIKVPLAVLKGSVVNERLFDDPYRSTIGRVITYAKHIRLTGDTKLPKVKGSDDAEKAKWFPISDIREDMMFDDHYHVINFFLGID